MNSLLWKQWHEIRGYLAIFTAWMLLAILYAIGYELGHGYRAVVGSFSGLSLFYTWVAAIFLAMYASRGEQSAGTLSFTAALPVSLRRLATMRIVGAAAALATPILLAASVLSVALAIGLVEQAAPRTARRICLLAATRHRAIAHVARTNSGAWRRSRPSAASSCCWS